MKLQPGTMLQGDKYRIIDVLGQGGFGITYLAEQVMAERKVCIKEFFPKEFYNRNEDSRSISLGSQGSAEIMDAYKAKFIKEAKTIARLDHPNIIHIFDVFSENNTAYYVMEYIDGESLSSVVRHRGALPEREAVEYIKSIASALGYIHERKIMHLDVKPANVMLRKEDGRPILIDFGLSKQYDAEGNQTSSTPVGISAGFAPMEQYQQGGVKEFSPETDIYSLGATLYFLVTGNVPPQAALIVDAGLPELPGNLSSGLCRVIEQSMEIQRRRRPHTAADFMQVLEGASASAAATQIAMPNEASAATQVAQPKQVSTPKSEQAPVQPPKLEPKPTPRVEPRPAETPKTPTPAPKNSSKAWLWIILAVLLIGGGVGGWLIYDKIQERTRIEAEQQRIAEEQKAQEEAARIAEEKRIAEEQKAQEEAARIAEEKRIAEQKAEQKAQEEAARKAEQQRIDNMVAQGLGRDGVYQVGDYYNRGGKQGVVFEVWNGGRNGKIVSLDQADEQWCTIDQYKKHIVTGANSETDGKANTDRIMRRSDSSGYPAFVWCRNKGNDWYLPAKDELKAIYKAKKKINNTMSKCGGESIRTTNGPYYWTSTEYGDKDEFCAWYVDMGDGYTGNGNKGNLAFVRAVSAF